jgi:predicted RNA-binding protein YlqC (UPF0109 family)
MQADTFSEADESIRSLILEITKLLVDQSDLVSVNLHQEAGSVTLTIRVDPSDIGKLVGKQGRTARSLRTIVGAASMKLKHRYSLNICESTPE